MRNLKRALSLALATVMTLGLMVVGTGAAAVGYDDVTSEDNVEAIEVLQAVGIMTGDENGNFDPDGMVTRNQMAVIMSQLLNLNYDYYRGTNPFTDVPSWAAPYVAACAAEGVVAGIGDGLYGGENQVTAAQAALMILKALGYFQYEADFDGDWQVATIRQASYIRLFDGIDASAEEALTRNQIAQLVLNGLKSNMVEFTGNVGATIGDVVINYQPEYSYRTSAASRYNTIDVGTTNIAANDQYYIQLGEELYDGDLELRNSTDDFGRPSRLWSYDGEDIGTYAKNELIKATYTVEVEGGDIYGDIGSNACDYELDYWVDGVAYSKGEADDEAAKLERRNDDAMGTTGNGVLTQVFVDTQAEETTIVEVHTYLAEVTADYNERTEQLNLNVYDDVRVSGGEYTAVASGARAHLDDVANLADFADGDMVLVTRAGEDEVIMSVELAEVVSEVTASAYTSNNDDKMTSLTADGTKYDAAREAYYEAEWLYDYQQEQLYDYTYDLYLDNYGYIIGIEDVEAATEYMFIVGYEEGSSVLASALDTALAIFPDGTMEQIDVRDNDLEDEDGDPAVVSTEIGKSGAQEDGRVNTWFTYTVDEDGVYELRTVVENQNKVERAVGTTIDRENTTFGNNANNTAYGNNNSVYITVEANEDVMDGGSIVDVRGVTTGIRNTSIRVTNVGSDAASDDPDLSGLQNNVFYAWNDSGYVTYAVVIGRDSSVSENFVYTLSGVTQREYISGVGYVDTYDAIVDGEETQIQVIAPKGDDKLKADNLYRVEYNADGLVIEEGDGGFSLINTNSTMDTINNADNGYAYHNYPELTLKGATLWVDKRASNTNYVILDDDVVFYVENEDGDYDRYTNPESAVNAAEEIAASEAVEGDVRDVIKLVAFCDGDTGYATTVVLDLDFYGEGKTYNEGIYKVELSDKLYSGDVVVYFYENDFTASSYEDTAVDAIEAELVDRDYVVDKIQDNGSEYVFDVHKGNKYTTYTWTVGYYELVRNAGDMTSQSDNGIEGTGTIDEDYVVPGETITITFERNKGWDKPAYTATFEVGGKEVTADMTTDENVATATITVPADIDDGDVVLKSVAPKA